MDCYYAQDVVPASAAERSHTFIQSQPGVHFHFATDREMDIWTVLSSQLEKSGFSCRSRKPWRCRRLCGGSFSFFSFSLITSCFHGVVSGSVATVAPVPLTITTLPGMPGFGRRAWIPQRCSSPSYTDLHISKKHPEHRIQISSSPSALWLWAGLDLLFSSAGVDFLVLWML